MEKRKIALFGGTFDPIHVGHTIVASAAADHIGAENIVFIPAKCSPLKRFYPQVSDEHRLKMTGIAIGNDKRFRLSEHEITKAAPSYTLETVRWFREQYSEETLFYWLVGADTIGDLGLWYKVIELIDECNLCAMYRSGCGEPDFSKYEDAWGRERIEKLKSNIIETPLVDISSTQIRRMLSVGEDVGDMLLPEVAEYIRQHRLYV
jgi:nicotinate-nucleotide adenylyltransferase